MSLLLLLNPANHGPPYSERLLVTARRLAVQEEFSVAVVTAHMAFEIVTERAFARLFAARGVDRTLEESLLTMLPDRTFQTRATRDLWAALTGRNRISKAHDWKAFNRSIQVRNAAVHAGHEASREDAQAAISAVEGLTAHIHGVVDRIVRSLGA